MFWVNKIASTLLIIFILVVYVTISSVSVNTLMNPTQTGKTVYFLSVILILILVFTILILSGYQKKIDISILDALLTVWFAYIILKSIIQKEPFSLNFAEFVGLAVLYLILKIIKKEHFRWIFLALITGGLIQAIYGNLQLWGYCQSHHNLFKLTGSFFNPGPYAGYLASAFPAALGSWLFSIRITSEKQNPSLSKIIGVLNRRLESITDWIDKAGLQINKSKLESLKKNFLIKISSFIAGLALVSIILVLPASRSRAAWLALLGSSAYLVAIKYKDYFKKWFSLSLAIKFSLVSFTIVILSLGFSGLYLMKRNSANGRILIWKVTSKMITDYPIIGTGTGGFKAHYMNYQAEYFRQNPDSDEAMVAGDANYAFNELFQQTAKHGLVGGFLLVLLFIVSLNAYSYTKMSKSNNHQKKFLGANRYLVVISKSILISILIFSMFSYPGENLPIKTSLVLSLALLDGNIPILCSYKLIFRNMFNAANDNSIGGFNRFNKHLSTTIANKGYVKCLGKLNKYYKSIVTVIFSLLTIVIIFFGIWFIKTQVDAFKSWRYAFNIYNIGSYDQSIKEFEKAYPALNQNGDYLTNYGKALSMAGKHEKAVKILHEAANYFPNTVVYTALGDCYKAIGQNLKAERAYIHAWYMNPSRFYPKYLLAKLYDESGQRQKALIIANQLLNKEIKIPSSAVDEIRAEMQMIIDK
jgi:hypothetical protein